MQSFSSRPDADSPAPGPVVVQIGWGHQRDWLSVPEGVLSLASGREG
jgi:hypothetical protein